MKRNINSQMKVLGLFLSWEDREWYRLRRNDQVFYLGYVKYEMHISYPRGVGE